MQTQMLQQPAEPELREFPRGHIAFRGINLRSLGIVPFLLPNAIFPFIAIGGHHRGFPYRTLLVTLVLIDVALIAISLIYRFYKELSLLQQGYVTVGEVKRERSILVIHYLDHKGDERTRILSGVRSKVYMDGDKVTVIFDPNHVNSMRRWALYPEMMLRLR